MNNANTELMDIELDGFNTGEAIGRLGGVDAYRFLINRYLSTIDEKLSELKELFTDMNLEATNKAVHQLHTLKGSALTLGAVSLAEIIANVEKKLPTATENERLKFINTLNESFAMTSQILKKYIA